jgi:adenylate cyclase
VRRILAAPKLNFNEHLIVVQQGELLTRSGGPEEGIEWIRAMRKLTAPDHTHHAFLGAASAQLGNRTAAGAHAREVMQREPVFTAQTFVGTPQCRKSCRWR